MAYAFFVPLLLCALSEARAAFCAAFVCSVDKDAAREKQRSACPLAPHSDSSSGRVGTSDATRHSGAETSARIPRISMQKNHFAISQSRSSRALCARARRIAKQSGEFISQCSGDPPHPLRARILLRHNGRDRLFPLRRAREIYCRTSVSLTPFWHQFIPQIR
jgi:hypothetical protein